MTLSDSLLLISTMLEKEGKLTLAHDVETALERITELEKEMGVMLEVIKAVDNVGVDFSCGKYELESDKIDKARAIFETLKEQGE